QAMTIMASTPTSRYELQSLLSTQEQQQMLLIWNATETAYLQNTCIHEIFEAQVKHAPDAVGLVFDEMYLTFHELNQRANRLAHYLRTLGVGPEVFVGLCLERSV